jgi:hypothetical protein
MQFFLYEIVARIVAIYLCFDCYRKPRHGLAERKIASFSSDPVNWFLDLFLDPSIRVADREPRWSHASLLQYLGGGIRTPEHSPMAFRMAATIDAYRCGSLSTDCIRNSGSFEQRTRLWAAYAGLRAEDIDQ